MQLSFIQASKLSHFSHAASQLAIGMCELCSDATDLSGVLCEVVYADTVRTLMKIIDKFLL